MTLFLIIVVVTAILFAVGPAEHSLAVFFTFDPGALVLSPVFVDVEAGSVDLVGLELANEYVLVVDEETSSSLLHSILVKPLVLARVLLGLRAEAVRLIVGPFPLVASPRRVHIITEAVRTVGQPVSLV